MNALKYKGYLIEVENDPWAIKAGAKFRFTLEDGGERIHSATSIEDAKEQIEEGVCDFATEDADAWSGGFAENH